MDLKAQENSHCLASFSRWETLFASTYEANISTYFEIYEVMNTQ